MIEEVGFAGGDDADVVDDGGGVGKEIADPGAGLAILFEGAAGSEEVAAMAAVHEGEALAGGVAFGDGFAVEFGELGFVFEEIELGGATSHEEEDDVFGLGGEVGLFGLQGVAHFGCGRCHEG